MRDTYLDMNDGEARNINWSCLTGFTNLHKHMEVEILEDLIFGKLKWFSPATIKMKIPSGTRGYITKAYTNGESHAVDIITKNGLRLEGIPCVVTDYDVNGFENNTEEISNSDSNTIQPEEKK